MRIAYLVQMAELDAENGVVKKIAAQARTWLAAGHTVQIFSLARNATVWPGLQPVAVHVVERGGPLRRLLRSRTLCAEIAAWNPDVIYFRYAYHNPGLPGLFRQFPTVAELNTDDTQEYALTLSPAKQLYHRLTRRRVLDAVTAFVPVTRELGGRYTHFGRPLEVIGNGTPLDDFGPLPPPAAGSGPRLVFIGTAQTPWHGLDRVGELAALLPGIGIDVIGSTQADWQNTVGGQMAAPPNLVFHGHRSRAQYEPLMQAATAAIGTLGLFRNHLSEACPLKVREYLALGLPVLAAYEDTDIPAEADYFLRLPNTADSLEPHRERIVAWLAGWQGRRVPPAAIAHLDSGVKEARRLAFIARFARAQPDANA
jgi:glycosyltransferase involved in cell wall biosynthesis